jgi:hypothetical protein
MKTTVLFLTILAITSMISAQKAFNQVKSLLINFKAGINQEQHDADVRNEKDTKECKIKIAEAVALVASRQRDVDELKKHIQWLENEKAEHIKDKKTREDRLVANKKMLENFKKERCDNNLLFVKQLREHMEAIDIMTLLRKDINDYFLKKKAGLKINRSFIERFAEFSHLLDEDNKNVFLEVSKIVGGIASTNIEGNVDSLDKKTDAATAQKQRNAQEVGSQHVDNSKGELQKLKHVGHTEVNVYVDKLHKKVIIMIDGLVLHLKNSRNELTKNEIKASEDFAIFQTNMERENDYLRTKIIELTKQIENLTNQLNVANAQLVKRIKLLKLAQEALATIRRICKEKKQYFQKETKRRNGELEVVANATSIFQNILSKLSSRVKGRADAKFAGKGFGDALSHHVKKSKKAMSGDLKNRVSTRKAVVF